jgi:hypothetical protein
MANHSDFPYSEADGREAEFEDGDLHRADASQPRFGRLALCTAAAAALACGVLGTVAYSVWFNRDQQAYAEAIATARQALRVRGPEATGESRRQRAPQAVMAATGQAPAGAATDASARATAAAMTGAPATMAQDGAVTANPLTTTAPTTATTTATTTAPIEPGVTWQAGAERGKQAVWSGEISRPPTTTVTALADTAPADPALADNIRPAPATPPTPAPSPRRNIRRATSADSAAQPTSASRSAKEARIAQRERNGSAANAARHESSLLARMGEFFRRVSYRQHDSRRQQQDFYSHP